MLENVLNIFHESVKFCIFRVTILNVILISKYVCKVQSLINKTAAPALYLKLICFYNDILIKPNVLSVEIVIFCELHNTTPDSSDSPGSFVNI